MAGKTRGRKKRFTMKQVQRMHDMRSEGLHIIEIGKIMNTAPTTISRYLLTYKREGTI